MTYHMSRVAHWMQNKTIAFYPTHILRQNHQMPFAEYVIAHLQILSGGDRFANTVQWFSMAGSVLGVSLIAKELGASVFLQLIAAIICATIPMGILQSSSTQNDYVASFWLVCAIYFFIRANKQHTYTVTALIGVASGLALLTKGTSYVYLFPFLLVEGILLIRQYPKKAFKSLLLIGGIALVLNTPHYSRNLHLYGNPLGPGHEGSPQYSYANETISLPIIISNIIRNAALHMETPSLPLNQWLEDGICILLGDETNNPASTWGGTSFHIEKHFFNEDASGNPFHFLLIFFSTLIVLLSRSSSNTQRVYLLCLLGASLLFCAYLRWQPWHSRLHLPLFVLASPIVAIGLSYMLKRKFFMQLLAFVMILGSIRWLCYNDSRPLLDSDDSIFKVPRQQQYFANRSKLMTPYIDAVGFLIKNGMKEIGLICNIDDWEYPLHVFLQQYYHQDYRLKHVNVTNVSGKLADLTFSPEAIITTLDSPETMRLYNQSYHKRYSNEFVSVFIKNQG